MPLQQLAYTRSFVTLVPSYNRVKKDELIETHVPEAAPKAKRPATKAKPKKKAESQQVSDDRFVRRQADQYPPMTPDTLRRIYRHLDALKAHLAEFPEDRFIQDMYRRHDKLAKHLLVRHNHRIVITIVNRFLNRGLDFEDLFQEGNLGLLKAIRKFDHTKGWQFSTYAVWWIKEGVDRAVKNQARTIRIPIGRLQKKVRVQKAYGKGFTDMQTELDSKKIAEMTGLTQKEVEEMQTYDYEVQSLDKKISNDSDATLSDILADTAALSPVTAATMSEQQERLIQQLDSILSSEDARLIKRRFGLAGQHERTDSQLADLYGVKDAEIKKRLKRIFEQLKEHLDPTDFSFD